MTLQARRRTTAVGIAIASALSGLGLATTGLVGLAPAGAIDTPTIVVNTTTPGIGVAGCTLAEAILSANQDANVIASPADGAEIETGCEAGSGSDVIALQPGATYQLSSIVDDAANHMGPTGTPMVTSPMIIEGQGAVIQHVGTTPFRAFAVNASGSLDVREVHVRDFTARGGNGGRNGGGGGLGAGGAIYVHDGTLLVQWSTFEGNGAAGGNGGDRSGGISESGGGGGGGGLGGRGGGGATGGGGGGGARGNGAGGYFTDGGGGGGTISDGGDGFFNVVPGGDSCGGDGVSGFNLISADGEDGCDGGGGGGGGDLTYASGEGGVGGYGGGGGGGGNDDGDGGHGGFGGGGGGTTASDTFGCGGWCGGDGGDGGFGGGGGSGPGGFVFGEPGDGGTFAGNANELDGGGGGGLGGAIFGHSATVILRNSTFTGNYAVRGVAGFTDLTNHEDFPGVGSAATNGESAGGAIFTVAGSLTVTNSTIAGNEATGAGAGLVVYKPIGGETTSLALQNTIIANNGGRDECYLRTGSSAVTTTGSAANLVTTHATDAKTPCPSIEVTDDPQLGALAANGGATKTMALSSSSPAIDAGDPTVATPDDQRGVARPQGGADDIGAVEYTSTDAGDVTPPTASPTQSPLANAAGWNRADVTVTWSWADNTGGSGIDTAACTTSSSSTGEGAAISLAATCNDVVGNIGSASYGVKVDKTAPGVTCGPTQTFVVGSTPATDVTATVMDTLSGPVASALAEDVTASDAATVGVKTKSLTGTDVAGNTTTISCSYVVAYEFLGFLSPISRTSFKRGARIPVRFQLGDASGAPIGDAAAAALLSPTCLLQVTLDGQVHGCATYDAVSDTFQYDLKTPKALAPGEHTIAIKASGPGGVVNTDSLVIIVR